MSVMCNILSKKIWELCNENGCWISAEHVPGSQVVADYISRIFNESIVIPWWPTQNWFTIMTQLLVDYPINLLQKKATLTLLLHENRSYPLFPKLQLLAICLSGKQWEIEAFRRKLWTSSVSMERHNNITL